MQQNLSASALYCLNLLPKVNTQLLIYNDSTYIENSEMKMVYTFQSISLKFMNVLIHPGSRYIE